MGGIEVVEGARRMLDWVEGVLEVERAVLLRFREMIGRDSGVETGGEVVVGLLGNQ